MISAASAALDSKFLPHTVHAKCAFVPATPTAAGTSAWYSPECPSAGITRFVISVVAFASVYFLPHEHSKYAAVPAVVHVAAVPGTSVRLPHSCAGGSDAATTIEPASTVISALFICDVHVIV